MHACGKSPRAVNKEVDMKKLIMLLASASAICAFAAYPTGINFDSANTGALDITKDDAGNDPGTSGQGRFWYGEASEVTATINEHETAPAVTTVISESSNVNYLSLETGTTPLYRTVNDNLAAASASEFTGVTIPDGGLYVDTLVQFTAGDPEMTVNDNMAKLGVWVCGNDSEGNAAATTNFVVSAGYIENGAIVATNYTMNTIGELNVAPGDWVRLTVKAIPNIAQGDTAYVGFVVFVNGTPLTYSTSVAAFDSSITLNTVASKFYTASAHSLLPSLISSGSTKTSLSCVGFSGTGAVDDIAFTDTPPVDAAKDAEQFTLAWGANVASIVCTDGTDTIFSTNGLSAAGSVALDIPEGSNVTVTATYANNYAAGVWTATGATLVAGGFENIEKDAVLTITAVAMNYAVTIGNVTSYAETLAGAVALASANGGTIVMIADENVAVGNEVTVDAADQTVVIDLAGKTYASETGDPAIFLLSGTLVITNSTVDIGQIVCEDGAVGILGESALVVYGGKFVGAIYEDAGGAQYTVAFYGGTYLDSYCTSSEDSFYLEDAVATGLVATPSYDEDADAWFFTIGEPVTTTYDVTFTYGETVFTTNVAPGTLVADLVPADVEVVGKTLTWTPAFDASTAVVDANLSYEAAYADITYSVKFVYGANGETTNEQSVVYGNVPTVPDAATVAVTGKNFTGWNADVVAAYAAAVYTATYADITYSVKFVYGVNGESTNEQTVVYGTVPTAPDSATVAVSGYTFKGWDAAVVAAYADAVYAAQYEKDAEEVIVVPGGEAPVVDESATNSLTTAIVQPAGSATLTPAELAAYQSLFKLTFTETAGGYAVGAELDATKATDVVTALDTAVSAITIGSVAAGTDGAVTVNVVPGLYYGVATGTTLDGMAVSTWTQAATGQTSMQLTVPAQASTATAGFYRIEASATGAAQ